MATWDWFKRKKLEQNIKHLQDYGKPAHSTNKLKVPEIRITSPVSSPQENSVYSSNQLGSKEQLNSKRHHDYSQAADDEQYQEKEEREFKSSIYHLADEQERVQQKVFTNWINYHVPNCIKHNLIDELKDGTKLLSLLEALTGESLPGERGKRLRRPHFLSNVNIVLQFLEKIRIKLVNINATDIVDGNPCIILGLIWTLILHFHIVKCVRFNDTLRKNYKTKKNLLDNPSIDDQDDKYGLKKTLIDKINERFGLQVTDFGPFWRDGQAFLTLVQALYPQSKAVQKGKTLISNRARLELAFNLAETYLKISKLLDPEDIDVSNPDERSLMTYVSQFLEKQPIKSKIKEAIRYQSITKQPIQMTMKKQINTTRDTEADIIRQWIADLINSGINQNNISSKLIEYENLKKLFEKYKVSLDPKTVKNWQLIGTELLIGKQILGWTSTAEEMLRCYEIPTSGEQVEEQLRKHRLFFECLPKIENKSRLLNSIAKQFEDLIKLAEEWKAAMYEASLRWDKYHKAKDQLKKWIIIAESKLQKTHEPFLSELEEKENLNDLRKFFGQRVDNEKVFKTFVDNCNHVLATLPESHHAHLKETLKILEKRFYEIANLRAPGHLLEFEFDIYQNSFTKCLRNKAQDAVILDLLNKMENIATVYWKRFADKSLLEKAIGYKREFEKGKKQTKDFNSIKKETLELIKLAESDLSTINCNSQLEILKHNQHILTKIKQQLKILKSFSSNSGNIESELKEIEVHLNRLLSQLKTKKKQKMLSWLSNEVPQKLELLKAGNDDSVKQDVIKFKQIIEEDDLIDKLEMINIQATLIDIERYKADSIEEARQNLNHFKSQAKGCKEFEKHLNFLDTVVLSEWQSIDELKGQLRDWLKTRLSNNDLNQLEEKKNECIHLLTRLEQNQSIVERLASEFALRMLKKDIIDLICNYDQQCKFVLRKMTKESPNGAENKARTDVFKKEIQLIQDWISKNNSNELLKQELPNCDQTTIDKITIKKNELDYLKSRTDEIYRQLKEEDDYQEYANIFDNLIDQMSSIDFDSLIYIAKEVNRFKDWQNRVQNKVLEIKARSNQTDQVINDVCQAHNDIDNLIEELNQIDVDKIAEHLDLAQKAEDERKNLNNLIADLKKHQPNCKEQETQDQVKCTVDEETFEDVEEVSEEDVENNIEPLIEESPEVNEAYCNATKADFLCQKKKKSEEKLSNDPFKNDEVKIKEEQNESNYHNNKDYEDSDSETQTETDSDHESEENDMQQDKELKKENEEDKSSSEAEEENEKDDGDDDDDNNNNDKSNENSQEESDEEDLKIWNEFENKLKKCLDHLRNELNTIDPVCWKCLDDLEKKIDTIKDSETELKNIFEFGDHLLNRIKSSTLKCTIKERIARLKQECNQTEPQREQVLKRLNQLLNKWQEVRNLQEDIDIWLRGLESEMNTIDLKDSLEEKKSQSERLKRLQKSIVSKKSNIDSLKKEANNLNIQALSNQVDSIELRYFSLIDKVQDCINEWNQYVDNHTLLDNLINNCKEINNRIKLKLKEIEERDDLENQLNEINQLINEKEPNSNFDKLNQQLQQVLNQTLLSARSDLSNLIKDIINERNELIKMLFEMRTCLNEKYEVCQKSEQMMKQVSKAIENLEYSIVEASLFTASLSEKKFQLDKAKQLEKECKSININQLAGKPEIKKEYETLLQRYEAAESKIDDLIDNNAKAYQDHLAFKECCDELIQWIKQVRHKIPSLSSGCLSDRLSLETSTCKFTDLLNKKTSGDEQLKNLKVLQQITLESSSLEGKKMVNKNADNIEKDYNNLFNEILKTIDHLEELKKELKTFKEEYESANEWLQVMESEIKNERTLLKGSTIEEKLANVKACQQLLADFEKGKRDKIDPLSQKKVLLSSHLEHYIQNQIKLIQSRHVVLLNLLKDAICKVNEIAASHQLFTEKCQKVCKWIKELMEKVANLKNVKDDKKLIEANLDLIKKLIRKNQEEGQVLFHQALNSGDKALRLTPSQAKDVIVSEMQDLKVKWERCLAKLSEIKNSLEMALIEFQETEVAQNKMKLWLNEHENKLDIIQDNLRKELESVKENLKSKLRKINSLVQDIESNPLKKSNAKYNKEIEERFGRLAEKTKEELEKTQAKFKEYDNFVNHCNQFKEWFNGCKEQLAKCTYQNDNRQTVRDKSSTIQSLLNNDHGDEILKAIAKFAQICKVGLSRSGEREIDNKLNELQSEYNAYKFKLDEIKSASEFGAAKWNEYDLQFNKCESWLNNIESIIIQFDNLQHDLVNKRAKLEEFQQEHLQQVFNWQTEFHVLNVKAQLLLETYFDSSISNAFTQLSSRYNQLVIQAKNILHALEQRFQEHQQHQSILSECVEFLERCKEKQSQIKKHLNSNSLNEMNSNLYSIKVLIESLKHQDNRIKYLNDLTTKVCQHTHPNGVKSIQESVETMKQDYNKLINILNQDKDLIESKLIQTNEFDKLWDQLINWFENEVESKMESCEKIKDKKQALEKFKSIDQDIKSHQSLVSKLTNSPSQTNQVCEFVKQRYEPLVARICDKIQRITNDVKLDSEFKEAATQANNWIKNACDQLDNMRDMLSEKMSLEKRLERIKSLEEDEEKNKVNYVLQLCDDLNKVKEKAQIESDLKILNNRMSELKVATQQGLDLLTKYDQMHSQLSDWCDGFQKSIINSTKYKQLLEECDQIKPKFDELNTLMDKLQSLINVNQQSKNELIKLNSLYTSLTSLVKQNLDKHQNYEKDKEQFDKYKQQLDEWINKTVDDIERSIPYSKQRLQHLHTIQGTFEDGMKCLNLMNKLAKKLSDEKNFSDQDDHDDHNIRGTLNESKEKFEAIHKKLNNLIKNLTYQLDQTKEVIKLKALLNKWFTDNQDIISELVIDHNAEISCIRGQKDRYKLLQSQIEENKLLIEKMREEPLEMSDDQSLEQLLDKFNQIENNNNQIISKLASDEENIQAYYHILQEVEKWLLQKSYQLMSHSSPTEYNSDQFEQELQKHAKIMQDIMSYEGLNELKSKGKILNDQCGMNKNVTDGQIKNIEESYQSLLDQGKCLELQLMNAKSKNESCKNALIQCEKLLNEYESSPINIKVQSLPEAKKELAKASKVNDQLKKALNNLQTASQEFAEATAAVSRPLNSEISVATNSMALDKETEVKYQMNNAIEQVKCFINSLENYIQEWTEKENELDSFNNWLDDKMIFAQELSSVTSNEEETMNDKAKRKLLESDIEKIQNVKIEMNLKTNGLKALKEKAEDKVNTKVIKLKDLLNLIESSKHEALKELDEAEQCLDDIQSLIQKCDNLLKEEEQRPPLKEKMKLLKEVEKICDTKLKEKLAQIKSPIKDKLLMVTKELAERLQKQNANLRILEKMSAEIKSDMDEFSKWVDEKRKQIQNVKDLNELLIIEDEANKQKKASLDKLINKVNKVNDANHLNLNKLKKDWNDLLVSIQNLKTDLKKKLERRKQMDHFTSNLSNWITSKMEQIDKIKIERHDSSKNNQQVFDDIQKLENDLKNFEKAQIESELGSNYKEIPENVSFVKPLIKRINQLKNDLDKKKKELHKQQSIDKMIEVIQENIESIEDALKKKPSFSSTLSLSPDANDEEIKNLKRELYNLVLDCKAAEKGLENFEEDDIKEDIKKDLNKLKGKLNEIENVIIERVERDEKSNLIKQEINENQKVANMLKSKPLCLDEESIQHSIHEVRQLCDDINKMKEKTKNLDEAENLATFQQLIKGLEDHERHLQQQLKEWINYKDALAEVKDMIQQPLQKLSNLNSELFLKAIHYDNQNLENVIENCENRLKQVEKKAEKICNQKVSLEDKNKISTDLQDVRNKLMLLKKLIDDLKAKQSRINRFDNEISNSISVLKSFHEAIKEPFYMALDDYEMDLKKETQRKEKIKSLILKGDNAILAFNQEVKKLLKAKIEQYELVKAQIENDLGQRVIYAQDCYNQRKEFEDLKKALLSSLSTNELQLNESLPKDEKILFQTLDQVQKDLLTCDRCDNDCSHLQSIVSKMIPSIKLEETKAFILKEVKLIKVRLDNVRKGFEKKVKEIQKMLKNVDATDQLKKKIMNILEIFEREVKRLETQTQFRNINHLKDVVNNLSTRSDEFKNYQSDLNELNDKWDKYGSENGDQIEDINNRWESILFSLDALLNSWNDLLNTWEQFIKVETKLKDLDRDLKNKFHAFQDIDEMKEILASVNGLRVYIEEMKELASQPIMIKYFQENQIIENIERDHQSFVDIINQHIELAESIYAKCCSLKQDLITIETELIGIDGLIAGLEEQQKVNQLDDQNVDCAMQIEQLLNECEKTNQLYINELQTLCDSVNELINQKLKDIEKGKQIRKDYLSGIEKLINRNEANKTAIEKSKVLSAEDAKEQLIKLEQELNEIKGMIKTNIKDLGLVIIEHSTTKEAAIVTNTLKGIASEINLFEKQLKERKSQVDQAIENGHKFAHLKATIEEWVTKVIALIEHNLKTGPLEVTLTDVKQRLNKMKELKDQSSNISLNICLSELSECINKILSTQCNLGQLSNEYDALRYKANQTHFKLNQEIAFTSEMIEEWEQYESKVAQVTKWLSECQAKMNIESQYGSIEDKLNEKEKLLSNLGIQKAKIVFANEKLSIHLSKFNLIQLPKPADVLSALDLMQSILNQQMKKLNSEIAEHDNDNKGYHQLQQDKEQLKESDQHLERLRQHFDQIFSYCALSSHALERRKSKDETRLRQSSLKTNQSGSSSVSSSSFHFTRSKSEIAKNSKQI